MESTPPGDVESLFPEKIRQGSDGEAISVTQALDFRLKIFLGKHGGNQGGRCADDVGLPAGSSR